MGFFPCSKWTHAEVRNAQATWLLAKKDGWAFIKVGESWAVTWCVRLLYWSQLRCISSIRWQTIFCCFPSSWFYPRQRRNLICLWCWLISPRCLHNWVSQQLGPSLPESQTLLCSAAHSKIVLFSHVFPFLIETLSPNETLQIVRAESPCTWAGIQQERVLVVNHHPNNVSQFLRGEPRPSASC